ncbi:MAG: DUF4252 domain-containing protein [Saprospiraceae bacterium]
MKKVLIFLAFIIAVKASAQDDALNKFFKTYMDDQRFSTVYISPKMFQLVSKIKINDMDADLQETLKNLTALHILSTHDSPRSFYKEALGKINTKEYDELMKVRDDGEDVIFLTKAIAGKPDSIGELLMLVGGDDEFTAVSFVGNIDLNTIGKLGKTLKIDGADHLEKIKKN